MKIRVLLSIAMLGLVLVCADTAMAYNINGWVADWGVHPKVGDWEPNPGVYYTVEDYVSPGGQVYPGWGGQQFDAEALYLDWDDTNLYLALVIGFPKTGVFYDGTYYSAGDIAIDFGVDGVYEYGIEIGGHYPGEYDGFRGGPGNVFKNINWVDGTTFSESSPLYMGRRGGDPDLNEFVGSASDFAYNHHYASSNPDKDRWVVEMSIPRDIFEGDWNNYMSVHWTQSCGNDNINVTTPEPMSLSLLGLGLLGMIGLGIRRRK